MKTAEFGAWRSVPISNGFAVRKDESLTLHSREWTLQIPLSSRKRQKASPSPVKLCVKAALRALGLAWLSLREDGELRKAAQ